MFKIKGKYIGFIIFFGVLFCFGYKFFQFTQYLETQGECGMSVGPIYGKEIKISTKDFLIEQYFDIPNGKIGFANLEDTKPPKMIKYGKNGKILWAIEFRENDSIGIPFYKLSKMELKKTNHGYIFEFFNHSYSEPGYICVDEDFNLKYMCLKAF